MAPQMAKVQLAKMSPQVQQQVQATQAQLATLSPEAVQEKLQEMSPAEAQVRVPGMDTWIR